MFPNPQASPPPPHTTKETILGYHSAHGDILILQKEVSSVVESLQNDGVYNNQALDNRCWIKKKSTNL
jgi:hypothetical protein